MTKSFAIIVDNKVTDTVVADTLEIAEEVTNKNCIEIPEGTIANIGWVYNGTEFVPE
jgi:hypothetical protein